MRDTFGSEQIKRIRVVVRRRYPSANCERDGGWYRITWGSIILGAGSTRLAAWRKTRENIRAEDFARALTS